MGSRHNRKRTRSRPRNRKPALQPYPQSMIFTSPFSPQQLSPFSAGFATNSTPALKHQQHHQLQVQPSPFPYYSQSIGSTSNAPHQQLRQQMRQRTEDAAAALEAERVVRMFGGDTEDRDSLCAPMLRVVMELFGGEVDYVDP